jgi:hypothetical protein
MSPKNPLRVFMSASAYRALYETAEGVQPLILEVRLLPDGEVRIFTTLAGQPIRANGFRSLLPDRPECLALRLTHAVEVLWGGQRHLAEVEEAYVRDPGAFLSVAVTLRLTIGGQVVTTELHDTLADAVSELRELGAAGGGYWLMTCFSCALSRPALPGPGWDDRDDHQCFRDTPEAYSSIGGDGSSSRGWGLARGDYFVSAFHTCAAWR